MSESTQTNYVVYDTTGRVLRSGYCAPEALSVQPLETGEAVLETAALESSDGSVWVVDGALIAGTAMAPTISASTIAADGSAECVITGLPDPCDAAVRGAIFAAPATVTGGSVTLTSTVPGPIRLRVIAQGYQDWEAAINAV